MFLLKLLPFRMLHRKVLSERIGCTAAIPHVFQVLPSQKVKQCRSFNNYVDQVLSNFNHLPPSSGQLWTFYLLSTLCLRDQAWTSNDHQPTSSCPRNYWMTPSRDYFVQRWWCIVLSSSCSAQFGFASCHLNPPIEMSVLRIWTWKM
jgi:hypothetical protein